MFLVQIYCVTSNPKRQDRKYIFLEVLFLFDFLWKTYFSFSRVSLKLPKFCNFLHNFCYCPLPTRHLAIVATCRAQKLVLLLKVFQFNLCEAICFLSAFMGYGCQTLKRICRKSLMEKLKPSC